MRAKKTGSLEDLSVVGVDIGKDSFHLVGFDRFGQLVMRKQIKRLTAAFRISVIRWLKMLRGAGVTRSGKLRRGIVVVSTGRKGPTTPIPSPRD